jgi:hypothetical protein
MVEKGERPESGGEVVEGWDAELERVFLGVRMRTGVAAGRVGPALVANPEGQALITAGKMDIAGDRILVLDPLFTDAVARAVLGLEPPS